MKLDKLDEHPGFLWFFFRLPVATWVVFLRKKPPGSPWGPLDSVEALVLKVRRQAAVTGNGVDQRCVGETHFAMAAATVDHKISHNF